MLQPFQDGLVQQPETNITQLRVRGVADHKMSTTGLKIRPIVWTGAFTLVTIVGTLYGAGYKASIDHQREVEKLSQTSTEERLAGLEQRRQTLAHQKQEIEVKLARVRERLAKRV